MLSRRIPGVPNWSRYATPTAWRSRKLPKHLQSRGTDEYRDTRVLRGATLGTNCTIVCGSTIGEYAFVGAGAVVNRDVPAFALIVGVPGRQVGWMSRFGERLDLPLTGDGVAVCLHTGDRYVLRAGVCRISDESTKRSHAHAD